MSTSVFSLLSASALVFGLPLAVTAQQALQGAADRPLLTASSQLAPTPPTIDGRSADAVWGEAPVISDFRQVDPEEGAEPSFRTEFQVAHDERNVYVFVRAFDPHPDSILRALSRRDVRGPSDQISIFIDSYNDRRTGFEFSVNPDGVKRDAAIFNDDRRDPSWNGVWYVATEVDSLGWTAEFRIPLSQLRYGDEPEHVFGLAVFREIERYTERVSWPAFRRNRPGLASQAGRLVGLTGLTSSRSLELTPYLVAKNETTGSDVAGWGRANRLMIGSDLKLRVTPNLTLDATINPDFGQVEADPAVLNLSAVETFLSERRPFFVEGTGLYRFALNCYIVVDCSTNEGLFYSRRIGRAPTLRDTYGDTNTPTATPIAAAAKLTGRTARGLSFGVLDALTPRVSGIGEATAEPTTNYAVFSAEQDLRDGETGLRVTATAVNRRLDEWTAPYLHESAYAGAASFRNRMFDGNYEVTGSFAGSRVAGSREALVRTQTNPVHYFQQPGDHLELDPERTSLAGHAQQVKFGKYGGGITRFETSFVRQSAGFEVNDIGFLRRADQQDWSTWGALRFNDPTPVYRWMQLNGNHWQTWSTSGLRLQGAFNVNGHMGLHNNWSVHAGATVDGLWDSFCDRCSRGGPPVRRSRGLSPWFGVNADGRRMLVPSMWVNLGYGDEGGSRSVSLNPSLGFRYSARLQGRIGMGISRNEQRSQWVGNFPTPEGGVQHTFAHLDQKTLSTNIRLNYTATPDLTFEFYAEPFVSRGTYTDFRELSATPGAKSYEDRYLHITPDPSISHGFRFRQLRTNAVARWEYLPGSTLFVVWSHGRQGSSRDGSDRAWVDEYRDLFGLHPSHTLLIKIAYWVNR